MIETALRSINISAAGIPIMVPTHSTKFFSVKPQCQIFKQSGMQLLLYQDILLARDFIVGITIPSSILFSEISLYSHHGIRSMWPTTLVIELLDATLSTGPRDILHSITRRKKSQSWFMQPNRHHQRHLKATFIIIQLHSDVWCPQGIPPMPGSNMIPCLRKVCLTYS